MIAAFFGIMLTVAWHLFGIGVWLGGLWRRGQGGGAVSRQGPSDPHYEDWDQVRRLKLFQAACLWAGKAPALPIKGGPEYAHFSMLKTAIADRELAPCGKPDEVMAFKAGTNFPNINTEVTRGALRKFAQSREQRPAFLFPEDRDGVAPTETYVVFNKDGGIVDRSNVGDIVEDISNTDEDGFRQFRRFEFYFIKDLPRTYVVKGGDCIALKVLYQRPSRCVLMVHISDGIFIEHGNSSGPIEPQPADMKIVFEVQM